MRLRNNLWTLFILPLYLLSMCGDLHTFLSKGQTISSQSQMTDLSKDLTTTLSASSQFQNFVGRNSYSQTPYSGEVVIEKSQEDRSNFYRLKDFSSLRTVIQKALSLVLFFAVFGLVNIFPPAALGIAGFAGLMLILALVANSFKGEGKKKVLRVISIVGVVLGGVTALVGVVFYIFLPSMPGFTYLFYIGLAVCSTFIIITVGLFRDRGEAVSFKEADQKTIKEADQKTMIKPLIIVFEEILGGLLLYAILTHAWYVLAACVFSIVVIALGSYFSSQANNIRKMRIVYGVLFILSLLGLTAFALCFFVFGLISGTWCLPVFIAIVTVVLSFALAVVHYLSKDAPTSQVVGNFENDGISKAYNSKAIYTSEELKMIDFVDAVANDEYSDVKESEISREITRNIIRSIVNLILAVSIVWALHSASISVFLISLGVFLGVSLITFFVSYFDKRGFALEGLGYLLIVLSIASVATYLLVLKPLFPLIPLEPLFVAGAVFAFGVLIILNKKDKKVTPDMGDEAEGFISALMNKGARKVQVKNSFVDKKESLSLFSRQMVTQESLYVTILMAVLVWGLYNTQLIYLPLLVLGFVFIMQFLQKVIIKSKVQLPFLHLLYFIPILLGVVGAVLALVFTSGKIMFGIVFASTAILAIGFIGLIHGEFIRKGSKANTSLPMISSGETMQVAVAFGLLVSAICWAMPEVLTVYAAIFTKALPLSAVDIILIALPMLLYALVLVILFTKSESAKVQKVISLFSQIFALLIGIGLFVASYFVTVPAYAGFMAFFGAIVIAVTFLSFSWNSFRGLREFFQGKTRKGSKGGNKEGDTKIDNTVPMVKSEHSYSKSVDELKFEDPGTTSPRKPSYSRRHKISCNKNVLDELEKFYKKVKQEISDSKIVIRYDGSLMAVFLTTLIVNSTDFYKEYKEKILIEFDDKKMRKLSPLTRFRQKSYLRSHFPGIVESSIFSRLRYISRGPAASRNEEDDLQVFLNTSSDDFYSENKNPAKKSLFLTSRSLNNSLYFEFSETVWAKGLLQRLSKKDKRDVALVGYKLRSETNNVDSYKLFYERFWTMSPGLRSSFKRKTGISIGRMEVTFKEAYDLCAAFAALKIDEATIVSADSSSRTIDLQKLYGEFKREKEHEKKGIFYQVHETKLEYIADFYFAVLVRELSIKIDKLTGRPSSEKKSLKELMKLFNWNYQIFLSQKQPFEPSVRLGRSLSDINAEVTNRVFNMIARSSSKTRKSA
ncbi:hypothetical protein AB834_03450 [PVC group bacterium (ex Bugula neritina AB1)]|nr:hypothetical protein AB834_03450 [PVC group bacterium (ex Bugula neritina AB1)]